MAQRPAPGDASRSKQGVEWRRERADVVRAGRCHLAHHVNAHSAQAAQGKVGGNITVLGPQNSLHDLLHFAESLAAYQQRSHLRQRQTAFAVHGPEQPLRNASPKIQGQPVTWAEDVFRARGKIHGDAGASRIALKHLRPKRSSLPVRGAACM